MPGLAGFACTFDKEHGLHALHVRAYHPGQDFHAGGVAQGVVKELRQFVREVDAEHAGQGLGVGHLGGRGLDAADFPRSIAADGRGFIAQFLHFGGA